MNRKLLETAAAELGFDLTAKQCEACTLLLQELLRWNKQINLTSIIERDETTVKHLIDSLHLVKMVRVDEKVLDMGSGAGFPALVLAITRPDCRITSIDSVAKKISFQKHIGRLLKLTNLEPLHGRVEALKNIKPGEFDLVTSRAFSNLSFFSSLAGPLVCSGGRAVSMRGAGGGCEAEQQQGKIAAAGFALEPIIEYQLPLKMGVRSLVTMRKVA